MKTMNSSFGWLLPAATVVPPGNVWNDGTSRLDRPGPSILMWMGVPSAARDERCSPDSCPIRPRAVNDSVCCLLAGSFGLNWPPASWALRAVSPAPWNALGTNAGQPPLVKGSVALNGVGRPVAEPIVLERNMYMIRSGASSPSGWRGSWLGRA